MNFKVKYFASLREKANLHEEVMNLAFRTPKDLYLFLKTKYQFELEMDEIKVAINGNYQSFDSIIKEGDVVTFIPPVAGG